MDTPEGRYGASSCVDEEAEVFHMLWGSSDLHTRRGLGRYTMDCLWSYDVNSESWRKSDWKQADVEEEFVFEDQRSPPVEVGACCAMLGGKMYCFGSWMLGICTATVFELDMKDMCWHRIDPISNKNMPLLKNKAGMVTYGSDMLFVFGGYGYPAMGQPLQSGAAYVVEREGDVLGWPTLGWTNEMHLFHLKKKEWIVPHTTGIRPPPCAAFSINKIDCHRVLLFGGRQRQGRVNEVHILDMAEWHWSGAIIPSSPLDHWPLERSFHTACCLVDPAYVPLPQDKVVPKRFDWLPCAPPDLGKPLSSNPPITTQRLLVLWGMDKQNADLLGDAWVLNVASLTWEKYPLPAGLEARTWHCSGAIHPTPHKAVVVSFGGAFSTLFSNVEEPKTRAETSVLQFGIPTLQHICKQWLAGNIPDLTLLQCLLPLHIYKELTVINTQLKC